MIGVLLAVLFFQAGINHAEETYNSPWHYSCMGGICKKELITANTTLPRSLAACQLFCGQAGTLWPSPTGHLSLGGTTVQLNPDRIELAGIDTETRAGNLLLRNVALLKKNAKKLGVHLAKSGGFGLVVQIANILKANDVKLTLHTNESYHLHLHHPAGDDKLVATITAKSYFGARHGLETLSQLIIFDDLRNEIQIVRDVYVVDGPIYPYRGILLDTSRNFVDKATILRTIEAMAMSKMNTFHWHITDSHSFPYVSRTWPQMSKYGSYDGTKIYSHEDVQDIIDFGLVHGVRVLPEFDAPAHVGEGWQWVGDDATVCFKAEPWSQYCVEPPCGQLNPTSERVYEILEGIYNDMIRDFQPDIFHMGGDEVNLNCWNSSSIITNWMKARGWDRSSESFYNLWNYFQEKALEKLTRANGGKHIPAILWTSGLTDKDSIKHLDPNKYIIQIWTTGTDETISRLLSNDFKVILSNYDALYLDCGFGAWVGAGNNWCSPYKEWQKIYDNSPLNIAKNLGYEHKKHLFLGGEATLWTEQADSASIDQRLWPRSAAFAERLWAEPASTWIHAEHRMLWHRERLVQRGIAADSLEPEWCLQNQGHCYL